MISRLDEPSTTGDGEKAQQNMMRMNFLILRSLRQPPPPTNLSIGGNAVVSEKWLVDMTKRNSKG